MPTPVEMQSFVQILHVVRSRLGGVTDNPDERALCAEWFSRPLTFALWVGSRPSDKHVLVHLDKTKWYGPGNVKWGTRKFAAALRRNSVKLRGYYAGKDLSAPPPNRKPGPRGREYEGKTITELAESSGLPAHRIRAALLRGLSVADALVDASARTLRDGAAPRGRVSTRYEGRSIEEWASLAGVSAYYIRKHMSPAMPMEEVVRRARVDKASRKKD